VVSHAIEGRWIKIGEVQVEFDIRGGRKGEGERRGDLPAAETERGAMICRRSWQELEGARRRIVTEGEKKRRRKNRGGR
jgi:hypothetical protein